jgi:hypothetical protein
MTGSNTEYKALLLKPHCEFFLPPSWIDGMCLFVPLDGTIQAPKPWNNRPLEHFSIVVRASSLYIMCQFKAGWKPAPQLLIMKSQKD